MATLLDYPDDWEEVFLSNPNFSMVDYSRKVDEYQRLLKAKQDVDETSGMGEGAGVRSDQIYDSADPAARLRCLLVSLKRLRQDMTNGVMRLTWEIASGG